MLSALNTPKGWIYAAVLVLLAAVPVWAPAIGQPYFIEVFTRILIWAIAALSLNLILGYGGMVSFGHAMYLGIGGYTVGIFAYYDQFNGFLTFPLAVLFSGLVGVVIGAICLRTRGIYFIMITLAFAQMVYYLGVSAEEYGSDDGLPIYGRSEFEIPLGGDAAFGLDISDRITLYYLCFVVMVLVLGLVYRIVNSRFGMVVRGVKSNEERMQAVGYPTYQYKLASFVIAAMICGLAGALSANMEKFVSPDMMHWTRSGEMMFMVILGGMGSLFGPILGATVFLMLHELLSRITEHWHLVFGPLLILVVLFAKQGLNGLVELLPGSRGGGNG